jgi:hypothetical protein
MSIGIIIISFNTCALLRACLASLRDCALPRRIVVVDNNSPDGSAEMVRVEFPEVELVALDHNKGFAGGNNIGLQVLSRSASGEQETSLPDYVLLLNPDTVVQAYAIEAMLAFLQAHPRVGAVGPRLLNPDGSVQPAAFRFPTLSMTALDLFPPGEVLPGRLYNSWWHGRYPQEPHAVEPFPIDHPLGACILVRREVIAQIGGMDEGFFMYAEEVDWCFRIRQAGWAIWQVPAARVIHVGGAATSQFRSRMLIALYESRLRFFHKHYSPRFVRWHSRIVRLGMLRAVILAWRAYFQSTINADGLRARLLAFGQVFRLG